MKSFYYSPSAHRSVTSVKAVNRWQTFKEAAFRVPHWSAAAVREEKNRIVDVTKNAKIHLRQMLESHKEQMRLQRYFYFPANSIIAFNYLFINYLLQLLTYL